MTFNPNTLTFDEGIERITDAYKKARVKAPTKIVTSRDKGMASVAALLGTSNEPAGFKKWQLAVFLNGPSQLFVSLGAPDSEVPKHSHDEGDGFRMIMSGSIIYNGVELTAGDWMFIPKGQTYQFKVGALGVMQCYCYQCCCVPRKRLARSR